MIDQDGFIKQTIHLPVDDFDEDDEMDARIGQYERRKKGRFERGKFFGTE